MAGTKVTKIEKEKRIFTIQGWIIDGVQDYLIMKQVRSNWDLSERQAQRYITEAYKRWKKDQTIDILQRRDARIAELQQDIRGMDEKFKKTPLGLRTILAFKKEISKLEDIYPARRFLHGSDPENPVIVKNTPFISETDEKDYKDYLQKKYNFKPKK